MLLSWIAPICPHTAEEAWSYLEKKEGKSIFYNTWYELNQNIVSECKISEVNWKEVIDLKKVISKCLEEKRIENIIGSPLDANIIIYCTQNLYNILKAFNKELKFIFITSGVIIEEIKSENLLKSIGINNDKVSIDIINSTNKKCNRCWHKCESVGENKEYDNICVRCISNVYGEGEVRENA